MSTQDNLLEAFAGESQANRKYLAFAKKAEEDGFSEVARLFRAAAAAETIHAHAHLRVMGGINSTMENLETAIKGEGFEFQNMYPQYVKEAKEEDNKKAEISFKNAMAVEEIHYNLYQKALESVKDSKDLPERKIFICEICGNTVYKEAPKNCPICCAKKEKFLEIK